jgi:hypothetical protein
VAPGSFSEGFRSMEFPVTIEIPAITTKQVENYTNIHKKKIKKKKNKKEQQQ